jgi:hypothetical protein
LVLFQFGLLVCFGCVFCFILSEEIQQRQQQNFISLHFVKGIFVLINWSEKDKFEGQAPEACCMDTTIHPSLFQRV